MTNFSSFSLKAELTRALSELSLTVPTPIQVAALPILLNGKDLIGQSKTGSGKTLAFALPLLNRIHLHQRGPQALVLCPTRELCQQVARELRKLGRHLPSLKVVVLVGGQPMPPQLDSLRRGTHVAVGTPGRVLDHLRRGSLDLSENRLLVLDEADRMLDMGFQEEMEEILAAAPEERQTVLFSATFPDSIEEISGRYQKNPERVSIEDTEEKAAIRQVLVPAAGDKFAVLLACLEEEQPDSAIIFCNLKITVNEVFERLESAGVNTACLHGDLDQTDRDRVMCKFRNGSTRVLVATDVAARGIDVSDLDLVVNYDLPKPDIYVHRIGRTGRAGKTGLALSLVGPGEDYKVKILTQDTGANFEKMEAPAMPETLADWSAPMTTLYVSGGRKDKVRPGDILGALTGEAGGITAAQVGKIEIHDRFTYVAVSSEIADAVIERLREGKIKGRKFRVELVL